MDIHAHTYKHTHLIDKIIVKNAKKWLVVYLL